MTDQAFITLLNMSLTAGYVIVALALFRLLFRRAPKRLLYGLWALPLFRLACPVSVSSVLSLLPSAQPIPTDITLQAVPAVHSGIPALNSLVNPALAQAAPAAAASVNPLQLWCLAGKALWLVGLTALLCYGVVSYARLGQSLRFTVLENGVWRGEAVTSPMVLGLFRPRIYLPLHVEGEAYILSHERAHIARGDHIVKPLAYLVLCVHWFNPLAWLAYILMCRDMEGACDERVLKGAGPAQRKEYAACLLSMGMRRSRPAVPLAFGESDTAGRIKRVLNYKKPAFWLLLAVALAAVALCVTLLTNPKEAAVGIIGGADGPTQIYLAPTRPGESGGSIGGADGPTSIQVAGREYRYGLVLGPEGAVSGVNLPNLSFHPLTGETPAFDHGLSEAELAELPLIPWAYMDSNVEIAVVVTDPRVRELRIADTLLRADGSILYHNSEGAPLAQEGAFTPMEGGGNTAFVYTLEPSQWALLLSSLGPHALYRCFSVQYSVDGQWNECCFVLHTQESVVEPEEAPQGEDAPAPAILTPAEGARRYAKLRQAWPGEPGRAEHISGDWDGDGKEDQASFTAATGAVQVRFGDGAVLSPSAQELIEADFWGGNGNMHPAGADVNGDGQKELLLLLDMGGQGGEGAYTLLVYHEEAGAWKLLPSPQTGPVYQVYWEGEKETVRIECEEIGYAEHLVDESLVQPYLGDDPEWRRQRIAWMEALGDGAPAPVSTSDPVSSFVVTEEGMLFTRQYLTAPGGSHAEQYGYMLTEYAYTAANELSVVAAWFVPVPV